MQKLKAEVAKLTDGVAEAACFKVRIGNKEYVRHGAMYTSWFEARDRNGILVRRGRAVESAATRLLIDEAIASFVSPPP